MTERNSVAILNRKLDSQKINKELIITLCDPYESNLQSIKKYCDYTSMSKYIALIPARKDSKRLPGKNIKLFYDKPLISYTIVAAKNAKKISRIIVSTDSEEIANISVQYGAEVPFIRPSELATEKASSIDVIRHAIRELEKSNIAINNIVLLQPTSPLRIAEDINGAINLFEEKKADTVVSIVEVSQRPGWFVSKNESNMIDYLIPEYIYDGKLNYLINGAIYVIKKEIVFLRDNIIGKNTFGFLMPPERSIDIDTFYDFHLAQLLYINR